MFLLSPDILARLGALGLFEQTKQKMPNHVIINEVCVSMPWFAGRL